MKMAERAPASAASFKPKARLWEPEVNIVTNGAESEIILEAQADDLYAAIDDLSGDVAALRLSRWPRVDAWGRLAFPRARLYPMTIHLSRSGLQARADSERARHGQAAPDRLLRVGDVFLVRDGAPGKVLEAELWDISAAGRDVAKAAYYGAGAATVDEEYIQQMVAAPPAVEVAGEAGAFDIRQQALPDAAGGQGPARA
mgnify:CR=1 FL=1